MFFYKLVEYLKYAIFNSQFSIYKSLGGSAVTKFFHKEGKMSTNRFKIVCVCFLAVSFLAFATVGFAKPLSVKEIVQKNIQAAGGQEKIAQIKNYTCRIGFSMIYVSADGRMKSASGMPPVITEVILTDQKIAKRNSYNNITEFKGLDRATYQGLAMLRSGLFTIKNFEDILQYKGIKSFGPEQHHCLSAQIDDLNVDFYLDSDSFLIKRIVFQGHEPDGDKYEINHDFGPYQEVEGIKIPSSWFNSKVGVRGDLYELTNVKLNQPLEDKLFSTLDVNVGETKIEKDTLIGNITNTLFLYNMLIINTNWTKESFSGTGFQSKDKLAVQLGDKKIEIDFYDYPPPRSIFGPAAKLMMPSDRDVNFVIILGPPEYHTLSKDIKALQTIRVKKL
jgi:hypothetical protein